MVRLGLAARCCLALLAVLGAEKEECVEDGPLLQAATQEVISLDDGALLHAVAREALAKEAMVAEGSSTDMWPASKEESKQVPGLHMEGPTAMLWALDLIDAGCARDSTSTAASGILSGFVRSLLQTWNGYPKLLRCAVTAVLLGLPAAALLIVVCRAYQFHCSPPACKDDESLQVIGTCLLLCMLAQLPYSLIILDSLDLARRLGRDAVFSGQSVGVFAVGKVLGTTSCWLLMRSYVGRWQRWSKRIIVLGLALTVLGLHLYSVVRLHTHSDEHGITDTRTLLIWSRIIGGFGPGVLSQLCQSLVANCWAPEHRPGQLATLAVLTQLGGGLGMILAALAEPVEHGSIMMVWASAAAFLVMALWVAVRFPSTEEALDKVLKTAPPVAGEDVASRRRVIVGALVISTCRGYIISAVMVAATMVLEERFQWTKRSIGLAVGAAFLLSLPVKQLHSNLQNLVSNATCVGICVSATGFGALLMTLGGRESKAWLLLLGVAMAATTVQLADALCAGVMQQNLLPEGSMFADATHASFYHKLGAYCGRLLGPWFATLGLQFGGPLGFDASQLFVVGIFCASSQLLVAPGALKPGDAAKG